MRLLEVSISPLPSVTSISTVYVCICIYMRNFQVATSQVSEVVIGPRRLPEGLSRHVVPPKINAALCEEMKTKTPEAAALAVATRVAQDIGYEIQVSVD